MGIVRVGKNKDVLVSGYNIVIEDDKLYVDKRYIGRCGVSDTLIIINEGLVEIDSVKTCESIALNGKVIECSSKSNMYFIGNTDLGFGDDYSLGEKARVEYGKYYDSMMASFVEDRIRLSGSFESLSIKKSIIGVKNHKVLLSGLVVEVKAKGSIMLSGSFNKARYNKIYISL